MDKRKRFLRSVIRPLIRSLVRLYYRRLAGAVDPCVREVFTERVAGVVPLCGTGLRIGGRIEITDPRMIILGCNVYVGENAYFDTAGGLTVGDNCHIDRNVTIFTSERRHEGAAAAHQGAVSYAPVCIGKNVSIGMNASILPGVTVGAGSVIEPGTVVNANIGANEIVGNAPMRVLKKRKDYRCEKLDQARRYGGINVEVLNHTKLPSSNETCSQKGDKLFFILSTGRCGSTSIAEMLTQHPDVTCAHEPNLQLVRLSTAFANRKIEREDMKCILEVMYANSSIFPPGYYGESDQKLSNLAEVLAELFPQAKFIWLIRNATDTVNSMFSRHWYSEGEMKLAETGVDTGEVESGIRYYAENRPNLATMGFLATEQWHSMTPFERNCCYWRYWNSLIEQQLTQLDLGRWLMVRLEELGSKADEINSLLGVRSFKYKVPQSNKVMEGHRLISKREWTRSQIEAYNQWCSEPMQRWYSAEALVARL